MDGAGTTLTAVPATARLAAMPGNLFDEWLLDQQIAFCANVVGSAADSRSRPIRAIAMATREGKIQSGRGLPHYETFGGRGPLY